MTNQQEIVTTVLESGNIVYRAYLPLHRENVSNLHTETDGRKYRIVTGAIVVDRRAVQREMGWSDKEASDHFTTFFDVEGILTDVRNVNFDFRHNGISTGAKGSRSWVVDDYEIEIDSKVLKVPARMLEVKVYEDSKIRFKGRNGETIEDGNLLEAIENGRVFTWSIEFKPVTQGTTRSGITVYRTYHTPRISFLDVTQGIPDAGNFSLRNFLTDELINNNMSITIESITQAIADGEITADQLRSLVEPENRDIIIDKNTAEGEPATPSDESTTPADEADTNGDGEISDDEMRSYIKEIKRNYDSPNMIKEKMDELERMYGDMSTRMDDMASAASQRQLNEDEIEAQRVRALTDNLAEVPDKINTISSEKTQLGEGENNKREMKDENSYTSKYQETLTAIRSGMYK